MRSEYTNANNYGRLPRSSAARKKQEKNRQDHEVQPHERKVMRPAGMETYELLCEPETKTGKNRSHNKSYIPCL